MRRPLPLALLALALGACIDDLEPQYRVTDLRLLAMRATVEGAEWADAHPGDTLRLEALVANPLGRAPVEITWWGCWQQFTAGDVPTDGRFPCLEEAVLRDPDALATTPGVFPIGSGPAVSFPVPADDATLALFAAAVPELERTAYACRLYLELGVVAVVRAGGREELGEKRVRITVPEAAATYARNRNPAVGAVLRSASEEACAEGTPVEEPAFPTAPTFLCGFNGADAAEPYHLCGPDGVIGVDLESLSWQWYVTAGEFPDAGGIGNATGDSPEFEAAAGPFTLWVILRDGRGGVGWEIVPGLSAAP